MLLTHTCSSSIRIRYLKTSLQMGQVLQPLVVGIGETRKRSYTLSRDVQVGQTSFVFVNVHLFFGSDKAKKDMDRRSLETFAVAR